MQFEYFTPTKIIFGRGSSRSAGSEVSNYGDNALIICGNHSFEISGAKESLPPALKAAGVTYHLVSPDMTQPLSSYVDRFVTLSKEININVIIGVGGGTILDLAKATGVALQREFGSVCDIIGKTLPPSEESLPVIAIPTTAGTGSEVSKGAIILDEKRKFKSGIRGKDLYPKVAIIDPELCDSMSLSIARETAFDALTHSIETYLCKRSNPLSQMISERSFSLISRSLPDLIEGNISEESSNALSMAALLGGINIGNCGSCLPHRLQQAMGSIMHLDVSHPRGLAIFYPEWLKTITPLKRDKVTMISNTIFGKAGLSEQLSDVLATFGMKNTLKDFGAEHDDLRLIQENISGNVANDPCAHTPENVERIIQSSY